MPWVWKGGIVFIPHACPLARSAWGHSHHLAAQAGEAGGYDPEIVQVAGAELARDEGIRSDTSVDNLGGLAPLFAAADGTVTAGNSSSIGRAAHELKRRGGGVAVAAICIGVGQGLAVVLER